MGNNDETFSSPNPIPGLQIFEIAINPDVRGWFKENWKSHSVDGGFPQNFSPIQQNVSHNFKKGTLRGFHAEPWDKLVTINHGSAFCAWIDLRQGPAYGKSFTFILNKGSTVFIPAGVANSFQTLEDETSYSYLVNGRWSEKAVYKNVYAFDPFINIPWPLPKSMSIMSSKDSQLPMFIDVPPYTAKKVLVLGAGGQVGNALRQVFADAIFLSRDQCDITKIRDLEALPLDQISTVINAAAFTSVDSAEESNNFESAIKVNGTACYLLSEVCNRHDILLVHYSSDYVYSGEKLGPYVEADPMEPLNNYGVSKMIGDLAVRNSRRHYILRTSGVIGDGKNFVRAMADRARLGSVTEVVDDQIARLTFAADLAKATHQLIESKASFGIYHASNAGNPLSWAAVAKQVFEFYGRDPNLIEPISSDRYRKKNISAKRPRNSVLSMDKLREAGIELPDAQKSLVAYLHDLTTNTE